MRKFYISLAVLGLIAGYFAKTDYWFEDDREVYFPITREQLKVKRVVDSELNFEMIKARLSSPYPEKSPLHSKAYDREVKARLGLLQAMFVHPLKVDSAAVKNFFAQVAKSKTENLMVRRQAYRNWLTFQVPTAPSTTRLASLASHSDEHLIGNLTEGAE